MEVAVHKSLIIGPVSVQRVLIDNVIGKWAVKFLMRHTPAAEMIAPRSASLFSNLVLRRAPGPQAEFYFM